MRRRAFLKAAGAAGAAATLPLPAIAQGAADFPNKPISLVMSWPARPGRAGQSKSLSRKRKAT